VANLPYSVASPILVELAQMDVAAGIPPAVEPGVSPGGKNAGIATTLENFSADPGGSPESFRGTTGGTPAATLASGSPQRIVATLQLEVARRLVAQADDDDYGVLSLLMQLRYEPLGNFKIPADCFFPAPDVDSACVILVRRTTPLLPPELRSAFVKIVKRAFSQRRKMMLKLLKQDWQKEKLDAAFTELKISSQERAEKISLEQFVALTEKLTGNG
jgi:16S rRNA A1518/A1519 N6-dimethyltransferase RsmA/KsgA/DIM1 with predicted DNA glycosylase/AP lyase activity